MRLSFHSQVVPLLPLLAAIAVAEGEPAAAQTPGQEAAAVSLLEQGDQYLAQGEYRRALTAFEQANRVYEDRCAACHLGLARAYTAWRRYDQAASAARAALQLSPPAELYARVANQLGVALVLQRPGANTEAFAEAEGAFRRALELGGGTWNAARYNLAGLLLSVGRTAEAIALAREYLQAEPAGPYAAEARLLACGTGRGSSAAPASPASAESDFFPPSPVYRRAPALPARARRAGVSGAVAVQVEVDADGCVTGASLVKGLGNGELDTAAVEAARGWVFSPATSNGQPVASDYMLTIDFGAQTDDPKDAERQFRERVLAKWPVQSR